MNNPLRTSIISCFKMNGLSLPSDSATYLVQILDPIEKQQHNLWLDRIIDKIQKLPLVSSSIKVDQLEGVVKELGKGETQSLKDYLHFINAFDVPVYDYDPGRQKFMPRKFEDSIFSSASHKPDIFRQRYLLLRQRTLHHDLFTPPIHGTEWDQNKKKFTLISIEFLLGSTSKLGDIVVLGMITQMKEGKYFLEDPTGCVELNLDETKFHTGLYTENCFVLAEGYYDCDVFNVKALGLPPPEAAAVTKIYHGNCNFFGGPCVTATKERLQFIEKENEEANILILSDVHLDKFKVLRQLKSLFDGYAECPPLMFVLMGNFLSEYQGWKAALVLKNSFKKLADLLSGYPRILQESTFVIIPGPSDPGFINVIPRPAFADCILQQLIDVVPNCVLGSNPLRIKYCSKEIVLLREDILTKMCRNSLYFPKEGHVPTHFVKTIIGQSSLCPLPMHVCPLYWSYAQALSIYPLPDLVVIADKYDPYTITHLDCTFSNPGPFLRTDFSFQVYIPSLNRIEDCQLPPLEEEQVEN